MQPKTSRFKEDGELFLGYLKGATVGEAITVEEAARVIDGTQNGYIDKPTNKFVLCNNSEARVETTREAQSNQVITGQIDSSMDSLDVIGGAQDDPFFRLRVRERVGQALEREE